MAGLRRGQFASFCVERRCWRDWGAARREGATARVERKDAKNVWRRRERKMNDAIAGATLETLDIIRILDYLPHRYPFLLIDRIVDIRGDESCVGIKNVTINEPQFQGHFPLAPVMPGVLMIEAMAQTAGV